MKKKGFTLVELLVVISIIALLLSILMPSLRKAREMTKSITCRSNLRQIGLGMKLYADSNSDYYPPGAPWAGGFVRQYDDTMPGYYLYIGNGYGAWGKGYISWMDLVTPYLGDWKILEGCPTRGYLNIPPHDTARVGHYGYNGFISKFTWGPNGAPGGGYLPPERSSSIRTPSAKVLATDMKFMLAVMTNWPQLFNNALYDKIAFPHDMLTNIVFADGHTEGVKKAEGLRAGGILEFRGNNPYWYVPK